jgi:hypothetical protein
MTRFRDGQEEQSGTIRRDPARTRRRRDDPGTGKEIRSTPEDGAASASAFPPEKKKPAREEPKLGPVKEYIDRMLEADRQAPRKQRHTAHRIWVRLRKEYLDHPIGEPTVRRYVQKRKQELGFNGKEVFVPQSYHWGQEGQVDWFEAMVKLGACPSNRQVRGYEWNRTGT